MTADLDLEARWLTEALEGNAEAFGRLIHLHEQSVYRSAYRMLRDRDEAAEVTQEAMVRAWQNLTSFRGEAPFAGWLTKIAIHLALNKLREKRKFVRPEDEEQHDAKLERFDRQDPTPLAELLERESREALARAIAELPEEFRLPLVLRVYEEYSYEQIAESLALPLGTVMSRLYRARERLARRVRALLGD